MRPLGLERAQKGKLERHNIKRKTETIKLIESVVMNPYFLDIWNINPFNPANRHVIARLEEIERQNEQDRGPLGKDKDIEFWEHTPFRSRKRSVLRIVLLNWLLDHPDKSIKEEFGIDLYEYFDIEYELHMNLLRHGQLGIDEQPNPETWMRTYNKTQRDFELEILTNFTREEWNDFTEPGPIDELYEKLIDYTPRPGHDLEGYKRMIWYFIDKFYMLGKLPEEIFEFFPNTPREDIEDLFQFVIEPIRIQLNNGGIYEYPHKRSIQQTEVNQDIRNLTNKYQVNYRGFTPEDIKIDFSQRYDSSQKIRDAIQRQRDQRTLYKPNTMTLREYGLIAKYMDNGTDLIELTKTHKKCRGLIEYFKYTPIPLILSRDFKLFEPRSADIRPRPRPQRRTVRTIVERPECVYMHYDEQEDFMLYHYSPLNNAKRFRIYERLCTLWQTYEQESEED